MSFSITNFSFERPSLWNLIVGHRYITVYTTGLTYVDMLVRLKEEMGDDWTKPVVLVSCANNGMADDRNIPDLEIHDYEYLE